MSIAGIHYFGIRHHGPGSAKRLMAALDKLQPEKVLIEGPTDCSELLPLLAHRQMTPPIALLAYAAEQPACSLYYPFAEFSPEYQACLWATRNHAELAFIDLPVNIQLALMLEKNIEQVASLNSEPDKSEEPQELTQISHDPIGTLAKLAGYEDGEAWWNDLIEQNSDDDEEIFTTVEYAMTALREKLAGSEKSQPYDVDRNAQREAYMRQEITKAKKSAGGDIAIVCGAWHVPALRETHSAKSDKELLKTLPSKLANSKVKATWIPWTSPRLASSTGYGAGVSAPMWYQHLWQQRANPKALEYWLAHVARTLRDEGQIVSTASVIEAVRLSKSLAAVRSRPAPGFEEIREAVVACLCFGESLIWQQLEEKLLLGNQVGVIPDNAPLFPLLEDLQRLQKKNKLKPEALERELALDLRSTAGLGKSVLLHRLNILGVPWGKLVDAGSSRGTFRERWLLRWEPEYAVRLAEHLVFGSTIEQAANNKLSESLANENHLGKLADTVQLCLESQLNKAAEIGLARLNDRAAHTSDALELLNSLSPLVNISRYGTAREMSLGHIDELINRLAIQAALALPYACRNINDEESSHFRHSINKAHAAMQLAEMDISIMEEWWHALQQVVASHQSSLQVAGLSARLLYQAKKIENDALQRLLQKTLSPGLPVADAARFFEGFFADAVQRLLYDQILLTAVENWLLSLESDAFVEFLPLFRRVFSDLDAMERKRMMTTILGERSVLQTHKLINPATLPLWPAHLERLGKLLKRDKTWTQ